MRDERANAPLPPSWAWEVPEWGRSIVAVTLAGWVAFSSGGSDARAAEVPTMGAEYAPWSDSRTVTLDETLGEEGASRYPDIVGPYARLIELAKEAGLEDNGERIFPGVALEEEEVEREGVANIAGVGFATGLWEDRAQTSMLHDSAAAESPEAASQPGLRAEGHSNEPIEALPTGVAAATELVPELALYKDSEAGLSIGGSSVGDKPFSLQEFVTSTCLTGTEAPWCEDAQAAIAAATDSSSGSGGVGFGSAVAPTAASESVSEAAGGSATAATAKLKPLFARPVVQMARGQLEVQRQAHLQQMLEDAVKEATKSASHADRTSPPEADSFEAELEEAWRYAPDAPDMEYVLPRALFLGVVSAGYAGWAYVEAREQSKDSLPAEYDIDKIEHYFRLRPELVLRRFFQVAGEVAQLSAGLVAERLTQTLMKSTQPDLCREMDAYYASELRGAVTRLGPAYVKIGQALSSRPDLVGQATMLELQKLQDALPFFPNEVARQFIREELGAYPERVFDWFSNNPVAAASLGQVYKAKVEGKMVAVKVQRPGLVERIAMDFFIMRSLADFTMEVSRLFGVRIKSDLVAVVDEYASRLFEELDYYTEVRNMNKFKRLYGDIQGIYIPAVYPEFSSRRVITTEWIDGSKVVDSTARVSPSDMPLLQVGIQCTLTQLLDKGFLHADPHGGNLLKTKNNQLAYLDFGLVSDIPPSVMDTIICAVVHLMNRDYESLANDFPGLALMSTEDLDRDFPAFTAALRNMFDPTMSKFRKQLDEQSLTPGGAKFPRLAFARLVDSLFSLAQSFNFVVPPYFLSNVRALGELEGLAMTADPQFNLVGVVYPYVARRLLTDPSPRLRKALHEFVVQEDGTPRWELIDSLLRDASMADNAAAAIIPTQAHGKRAATSSLGLAFDFMTSREGDFLRGILVQQLAANAEWRFNRAVDAVERRVLPRFVGLPTAEEEEATKQAEFASGTPAARESRRRLRRLLLRSGSSSRGEPSLAMKMLPVVLEILSRVAARVTWKAATRLLSDFARPWKLLLISLAGGGRRKQRQRQRLSSARAAAAAVALEAVSTAAEEGRIVLSTRPKAVGATVRAATVVNQVAVPTKEAIIAVPASATPLRSGGLGASGSGGGGSSRPSRVASEPSLSLAP